MPSFEQVLKTLVLFGMSAALGGLALAYCLYYFDRRWTWALFGLLPAFMLVRVSVLLTASLGAASLVAAFVGAGWHRAELAQGGDLAERARERVGILSALMRFARRRLVARRGWVHKGRLTVGRDRHGGSVSIPVGERSGSHALLLGATGSGKTVTEAWIACRLIAHGHGAIVIDPKGDQMLRAELKNIASRARRQFLEWTPEGPCAYNPYANGRATEIADKALAGEVFTEPHYLRLAQRYLGHAVRAMHAAEITVTPVSLMAHMEPDKLDVVSRELPAEQAVTIQKYLDSLSERQQRDLAGARDRLSILAESDISRWLEPDGRVPVIDLHEAVTSKAVVYFVLDADRRPLLAQMLAASIISDLVSLVAHLQADPIPTVVLIDEFSAIAAEHVARLFGRARSAGISLLLGTQELADLHVAGDGLRDQVLGNVETLIAHRQNVPASAEMIANVASSKPVWVTTQHTEDHLISQVSAGRGSRRRDYDYEIHPSQMSRLGTGQAVVITPGSGQRPTIANINHPSEAH
jgi:type IV secretory pathway TraG/TraD family ATPase VirD4